MSSSASISAAKKRRANQIQPQTPPQSTMQRPGSAPAPSLANMTPAQRQQFIIQQQRMMQQQQMQQQQMQQPQMQQPQMQQQQGQKSKQPSGNQKAPSSKVPALTWPMPPIYLMKQMDTILFQQSQSIDELKNRLNCIETGSLSDELAGSGSASASGSGPGGSSQLILEQTKHSLLADDEFVSGIVDNIMTNSNLAEIIEQIDTVQTENKELRELLYAQQKTINEMNIMLLKLISQSLTQPSPIPASVSASPSDSQPQPQQPQEEEVQEEEQENEKSVKNNIQLDVIETGTNA